MGGSSTCWLEVSFGRRVLGRMHFALLAEDAPRTCENFRCLCTGERRGAEGLETERDRHGAGAGLRYKGSRFHRLIPGFMVQGGDFTNGDGTGGRSIYGKTFEDEPFIARCKHDKRGLLSMANAGPDTNGSQFFILFAAAPHLDGKHVVFGHLTDGWDVLDLIEKVKTDDSHQPKVEIRISDCGGPSSPLLSKGEKGAVRGKVGASLDQSMEDRNREAQAIEADVALRSFPVPTAENPDAIHVDVSGKERALGRLYKKALGLSENVASPQQNARKRKLLELQQKRSAARAENQKEVVEEHRRLSGSVPADKTRKQVIAEELKRREDTLERFGVEKNQLHLLETAEEASRKKRIRDKKAENIQASIAYHPSNDDMAKRGYDKGLKRLSKTTLATNAEQLSVLDYGTGAAAGQGARERLASEIKSKAAQTAKRDRNAKRATLEGQDVSAINSRNEAYNTMISKAFDKYTTELRENLERGTAL